MQSIKHIEVCTQDGHQVENFIMREYRSDGRLLLIAHYVNSKLHGVRKSFYNNGTPWREDNYANGRLHGLSKSWHTNGMPWEEISYKGGRMHGLSFQWWGDGEVNQMRHYVYGKVTDHAEFQKCELIEKMAGTND